MKRMVLVLALAVAVPGVAMSVAPTDAPAPPAAERGHPGKGAEKSRHGRGSALRPRGEFPMPCHHVRANSVADAQRALHAQGYYDGKVDGVAGSRTRAAVKRFQEAEGLKATGDLDAKTAQRLSGECPEG